MYYVIFKLISMIFWAMIFMVVALVWSPVEIIRRSMGKRPSRFPMRLRHFRL